MIETVSHPDPFYPILKEVPPPVDLTMEQSELVRMVLSYASSDTRFAQKAFDAITLILRGGIQPTEEFIKEKEEFKKFKEEEK